MIVTSDNLIELKGDQESNRRRYVLVRRKRNAHSALFLAQLVRRMMVGYPRLALLDSSCS